VAEEWVLKHNDLHKPEGGESFRDIQRRFIPFIESLTHEGRHKEHHVLLVGHGGLFHLMLPLVLANVDVSFVNSHGMGHTDTVLAELRPNGLTCLQWGPVKFDISQPQMS
jgi:broad specificity phosphatase PhoE